MLSQHLERQNNRSRHNNSKSNSNTMNPSHNPQPSFDNSQQQPVWVKLSIVKQKSNHPHDEIDDNLSINSSGSRRNFNTKAALPKANNRGANGWGWLFGYAIAAVDESDASSPSTPSAPCTPHEKIDHGEGEEGGDTTTVRTSPFGTVKLRKIPRSSTMLQKQLSPCPSSSNSPMGSRSPSRSPKHVRKNVRHLQQPKTILLQDEWNTTFNGCKVDLTAEEVAKNVVLANTFSLDQDKTAHHQTNGNHQGPSKSVLSTSTSSTNAPSNLIELTHLHEPSLIKSLKDRYDHGKVYTFCGKILLALNPFRQMSDLYSKDTMKKYWNFCSGMDASDGAGAGAGAGDRNADKSDVSSSTVLEPHVYAIAHETYNEMIRAFDDLRTIRNTNTMKNGMNANTKGGNNNTNNNDDVVPIDQSILVSGESGAGKTVTTKIVMQYLASLSEKSNLGNPQNQDTSTTSTKSTSMEQQVLQSNPILESFGNARTIRNDNSSRFGKFIEIQFHKSGCLMGASIHTYLLEKVRLIRQAEGERNYHIFYEMLNGLQAKEKREFGLNGLGVSDFRITACSGTVDRRDGVKDHDTYRDLCHAMKTVGFTSDEQREILQVTSGLLHMSNIDFMETNTDSVMIVENIPSLKHVLKNFGVNLDLLSNALCTCTITVGQEVVKKSLTLDKVEKAMEALMKATYSALFEYIVKRVNNSITVGNQDGVEGEQQSQSQQDYAFIKILDIFGFESFEKNSFEQLCINYCNEALQQQFNKFIFKLEQQEYEKENIAWSFISFPDNQDVLDLIEKKHTGIFSILDEQCKLAKCTDSSFSHAMYEKCGEHSRFGATRTQKARGLFAVQHYAGTVEYDTTTFLNKNKDELPKEATDFLLSSSITTVNKLGEILSNTSGTTNKRKVSNVKSSLSRASVGNQFTAQLRELRNKIDLTAPHYIRCIKPNDELTPDNFVPAVIADQLNCAGVLEAVRVSRVGYPQRYTKDLFVKRYLMLSMGSLKQAKYGRKDVCGELVENLVPLIWAEQQGKSDQSQMIQSTTFDLVSVGIQLGRTKVFLRHQAFNALEYLRSQKQRLSATKIQSAFRMYFCKLMFEKMRHSALTLQCSFRSYQARKKLKYLTESQKAVIIQSAWRGYAENSRYSIILFMAFWCQRVHRGNVARARVNSMLLDKKVTIIQSWWRMEICKSRYAAFQLIAFNMQQHYRNRKARRILRQLKIEAKDISRISRERDRLQEELAAWKEKEKSWKKALETSEISAQSSNSKNNNDFKRLNEESKRKDEEIIALKNTVKKIKEDTLKETIQQNTLSTSHQTHNSYTKNNEVDELKRQLRVRDNEIIELKKKIIELQDMMNSKENYKMMRNTGGNIVSEPIGSTSLLDFVENVKTPNTRSTVLNELNESWSQGSRTIRPNTLNFETPIHTAIRAADECALSVAITNCEDVTSDINRGGRDGKSPLHLAVLNSNIASTKFLLQNQSVANTQDDDGNTPLHYAESSSMVKILLEVGKANPNIPNEAGITAIHVAVRRRDLESVKLLIEHHANINAADDNKWLTPLHLIAQSINFEHSPQDFHLRTMQIAQILLCTKLQHIPEVDYQDKDGNTPLHHASVLSSHHAGDLISLFLKKKASPNIQNNRGQTVLHLVLHNMNMKKFDFYNDLVQLIIYHGSRTDLPSLSGCTPLHLALYHQDTKNATILLENGAQLHHPWEKPSRWQTHWTEHCCSSEVYCMEMVDDEDLRLSLISSIKSKQNAAPLRSNCMFCKRKVGTFARPKNCQHCGSFICGSCAPNKLDKSYFPSYCHVGEDEGRVCVLCETILISRRRDENIMGREVYAIHGKQEDVSFLDMDTSNLGEGTSSQLQVEM